MATPSGTNLTIIIKETIAGTWSVEVHGLGIKTPTTEYATLALAQTYVSTLTVAILQAQG